MTAIKDIRTKRNLTQGQLADKIGQTQANVSRYENGERKLDLETAAKIAKALGCKVDDLVREQ